MLHFLFEVLHHFKVRWIITLIFKWHYQIIAIDASLVGRKLQKPTNYLLIFLLLFHPICHGPSLFPLNAKESRPIKEKLQYKQSPLYSQILHGKKANKRLSVQLKQIIGAKITQIWCKIWSRTAKSGQTTYLMANQMRPWTKEEDLREGERCEKREYREINTFLWYPSVLFGQSNENS